MKQESNWEKFVEICFRVKDKELLLELFDLLFTHEEKDDFAKRCQIIHALIDGEMTQRQMAQELEVSIAKITRGSNALKQVDPKIIEFFKSWAYNKQ